MCLTVCSCNTTIEFISSGSTQPKEHCTGTACRPDLVAIRKEKPHLRDQGNTTKLPKWVDLEAVLAYHSSEKTIEENIQELVAYVGYLLMAWPDRVAVLGLHVKSEHSCGSQPRL